MPVQTETASVLAGPWTLQFPGQGQPVAIKALGSWTDLAEPQWRYFSGQASYRTSFAAPALKPGRRVVLDLGGVDVIAQVLVNGKPAGTLWKAPYQADVTGLLKAGRNALEVKVTNLWANRLIGDTAEDGGPPATFTTFKPYRKGAKLLPSGLSGPVRVLVRDSR
jgi:beta-galactosidase/beta-glucuronidase